VNSGKSDITIDRAAESEDNVTKADGVWQEYLFSQTVF